MNIDDIKDDILNKFSIPHAYFPQETIVEKKMLAWHIFHSDNEVILLPTTFAFSYAAFIAGFSEKHIEYIAKNAPADYKKELLNAVAQDYKFKEILDIARLMDEDMGNGVTQNQKRVENVRQYVLDNLVVFQF